MRLSLESCWSQKGHGLDPLPWCASILDRCCSPIVWREPRCLTESHRAGQEPPPFTTLAMRGALEVYKSSSWVLSACRTSFLICWRHTESASQRMESVYLRLYAASSSLHSLMIQMESGSSTSPSIAETATPSALSDIKRNRNPSFCVRILD